MGASLKSKWVYLLSVALLLCANFVIYAGRSGGQSNLSFVKYHRLPLTLGGWQGTEITVSRRALEALGTSNVLFRQYRKGNETVYLYILESAANRTSFHPPEYCYVGGRTEMVERGTGELAWGEERIPARRFIFLGPRGKSLVYYVYAVGRRFTISYYRQQLLLIFHILRGTMEPSFLIRLSVEGECESGDEDGIIKQFARDLFPLLSELLRKEGAS